MKIITENRKRYEIQLDMKILIIFWREVVISYTESI